MFVIGWGTISMAATCNTIIQLTVPDVLRRYGAPATLGGPPG